MAELKESSLLLLNKVIDRAEKIGSDESLYRLMRHGEPIGLVGALCEEIEKLQEKVSKLQPTVGRLRPKRKGDK
jgi:hypothetical protein